jgi:hypothetical protein
MAVNFDNFFLKIAKFESEAPKLLNLGSDAPTGARSFIMRVPRVPLPR